MIRLLIAILFSPVLMVSGQDTTYFDIDRNKVKSIEYARYYKIIYRDLIDTSQVLEKEYFVSGQIMSETSYSDYSKGVKEGKSQHWYENGQIRRDINYRKGQIHSRLLTYWENGHLKRSDTYETGKLIEGKCMDSLGSEVEHYDYWVAPRFPGGTESMKRYLMKELKYPASAQKKRIEGVVYVAFVVGRDGEITDVRITKGSHKILDKEALRLIKSMSRWIPHMYDGEAVKIRCVLPIRFQLD